MPNQKDLKGLPVTDGQGGPVVGEIIEVLDGVATARLDDERIIRKIMGTQRCQSFSMEATFSDQPPYQSQFLLSGDSLDDKSQLICFSAVPKNQLIDPACVIIDKKEEA